MLHLIVHLTALQQVAAAEAPEAREAEVQRVAVHLRVVLMAEEEAEELLEEEVELQ
jgi:hypothetical protein